MKQCTADTHQCVYLPGNCGQASDCSDTAGTPVCDVTVHQCVQCLSNTDCTPPLICSLENNACVMPPPPHCTTDNDCDGGTATPYCDPGVGLCVQCTSTDAGQCPRPQICRADSCTAPGGCLSDNDCTSAQLPYCNISTGRCVQCVSTAACNPPQACVNYTCGMCATNVDCIGSLVGSVCDPPTGNCVQCELDSDCPKPGAMCVSNMCMGGPCSSDADCANNPNGTDYCELDAGTCVQCTVSSQCTTGLVCQNFTCGIPICMTDADCVGAGGGPHCDSTTMHCVQCTDDSQCPGGDVCDPTTHTCGLLMCTMDSDCAQDAAAQHCDPVQMICVECLQDSDCPMSQSCLEGACGTQPTCMADSDCLPSQSCVPLAANDYTVWTLRCVPNSRFGNVEGGGACGSNSDCISNNCYFFPGETSDGICLDACTTSSDCDFFNGDCPTNGVALTVPGPAGAVSVTPICWSQTCTNDYDCEYTGFEDSNRICGLMPDPTNLTGAFVESCVPAVGFVPGGNPCASDIQCMSNLCLPYTSTTPSHSGARCFGACGSDFDCSSTGTIQAKCLSSQVQNNGNTIMVHTCVVEP
jgi:Cys-rich repeat protein